MTVPVLIARPATCVLDTDVTAPAEPRNTVSPWAVPPSVNDVLADPTWLPVPLTLADNVVTTLMDPRWVPVPVTEVDVTEVVDELTNALRVPLADVLLVTDVGLAVPCLVAEPTAAVEEATDVLATDPDTAWPNTLVDNEDDAAADPDLLTVAEAAGTTVGTVTDAVPKITSSPYRYSPYAFSP